MSKQDSYRLSRHSLASFLLCAVAPAALMVSPPMTSAAHAQPAEGTAHSNILEEVVVTAARKRNEAVQSTPVAVTAVDDAILERAHVADIKGLSAMSPNLYITGQLAGVNTADIYLRGFGSITDDPSVDPAVALYVDGVYQPTSNGALLDLYDVEKIEVLRGPQNTILGKNSPSGAISVTSKRPTGDFSGQISFDYSRFDRVQGRILVNVPLVKDILAIKVAYDQKAGGNYITNLYTGKRNMGGTNVATPRLAVLFTPSEKFEWLVNASATMNHSPQQGLRNANGPTIPPYQAQPLSCTFFGFCGPNTDPRFTTNSNWTKRADVFQYQIASNMSYEFEPVTVKSTTGYWRYAGYNNSDVDGLPIDGITAIDNRQGSSAISQQVVVSSNKEGGLDLNGKLDWLVGAYYFHQNYSFEQPLVIFAPPELLQDQHGETRSMAVFTHLVFNITDKLALSYGFRETWDKKHHDYTIAGPIALPNTRYFDDPISFSNSSSEAGISYKFNDEKMVYFRYAQGYRGGGFVGAPSVPVAVANLTGANSYSPEKVGSFEVGVKADWLNKKLRTNVAMFMGNYKSLQRSITKAIPVAPGFVTAVQNAAGGKVQGVELELTAVPTDSLTFFVTLGYLDAKYKNFIADITGGGVTDNSDIPFARAPRWTFNVGGDYVMDLPKGWGTATFNANWEYRTSTSLSEVPAPVVLQGPVAVVNAGLKFMTASEKYSLTLYGKNILNRYYFGSATSNAITFAVFEAEPATYGVTLSAKF